MAELETLKIVIAADTTELKKVLGEVFAEIDKAAVSSAQSGDNVKDDGKNSVSLLGSGIEVKDGSTLEPLVQKFIEQGTSLTDLEEAILKSTDNLRELLETARDSFLEKKRTELERQIEDKDEIEAILEVLRKQSNEKINDIVDDFQTEVGKAVEELSQKVADAFVDMALKGEFSIKKIGNLFLETFLDLVSKKLIQEPLEEILGSVLDAGLSILGFAGGGEVQAGVPIHINEQGQEIFIPHTPGRIANADESRQVLGSRQGVVVNQNLKFDTAIRNDMIATIMQASPLLVEQTKRAVLESVQGRRY